MKLIFKSYQSMNQRGVTIDKSRGEISIYSTSTVALGGFRFLLAANQVDDKSC